MVMASASYHCSQSQEQNSPCSPRQPGSTRFLPVFPYPPPCPLLSTYKPGAVVHRAFALAVPTASEALAIHSGLNLPTNSPGKPS